MSRQDGISLKVLLVVAAAGLLLAAFGASAQQCNRRAITNAEADVYRTPPRFVTGLGWQGERLDVVSNHTQVLKCDERAVPFGLTTKTWSQIAYQRNNAWRYGWVLDEKTQVAMLGAAAKVAYGSPAVQVLDALVPAASAATAEEPASSAEKDAWSIPATAPNPPDANDLPVTSGLSEKTPTLSELLEPYLPLFFAMILGMVAKAIVDLLDADFNRMVLSLHVRRGLVALLVSPIVFLGFLSSGQFDVTLKTFLVLLLLAFQNGFFWQTLLKRDDTKAPSPAPVH